MDAMTRRKKALDLMMTSGGGQLKKPVAPDADLAALDEMDPMEAEEGATPELVSFMVTPEEKQALMAMRMKKTSGADELAGDAGAEELP